jgi:hypothetical protein
LQAIQEKTDTVVEYDKWVPCAEGMHKAVDVLQEIPERVMCEDTTRVTDQHLTIEYQVQLKTQTQDDGEPLQFATAIERMIHHAFPAFTGDQARHSTME